MASSIPGSTGQPNNSAANVINQTDMQDDSQQIKTSPTNANSSQTSTQDLDEKPDPISLPEAGRTKFQTAVIMGALIMSLFLSALDSTIVTTAVPTIVSHFNAPSGYIWIGSAYLLGNASVVPVWGKLSDIFGRKQTLLLAVGIFLLGSLLCAISRSMGMLIAARAIQGVGGGGAVVLPNICVSDLFSLKERGMYFALLSSVWALASALGPVMGGVFTSRVSWRWCFYINLPFGGLALGVLVFFLHLHNPRTPLRQGLAAIDWVGNLLIMGGTLMILMGLQFGGDKFPWKSATVICLIVFGAVVIALFCIYESRFAVYPVMPPRIFQYRNTIAAYSLSITHAMGFLGGSYWLPLYFQAVLGANSLLSGVYLLPYVVSSSFASIGCGFFIKKTGNFRWPISVGLFVMTIGFGLLTYLGDKPHWDRIIIFQIIAGLGSSTNFQAPLIAVLANVEPQDSGAATAAYSFARQIGTSVSVVIGGVVFSNAMNSQQGHLRSVLGAQIASEFNGRDASASVQKVAGLSTDQRKIVRAAYWDALQKMFILYACVVFVGLLISLFIRQVKLSQEHVEYKTGLQSLKKEDYGKTKETDKETPPDEKSATDRT
ncbi:major facilitator superfamily transporter [Grosmannia clavigera kw1407]|uniref:Major facilitator superfamily transporter n=1 Tax=Grosmannia clavigera (strain kw1407 / UAMH 11150) TaxID=655863 RepID=F0X7Q2_GROCL|nr:major facilitator superfamily transporter [Grosmannia clavigera kw1407]EFX06414.1 major facilitator superfamily transporter [Grosmannia clavigera kw1407]